MLILRSRIQRSRNIIKKSKREKNKLHTKLLIYVYIMLLCVSSFQNVFSKTLNQQWYMTHEKEFLKNIEIEQKLYVIHSIFTWLYIWPFHDSNLDCTLKWWTTDLDATSVWFTFQVPDRSQRPGGDDAEHNHISLWHSQNCGWRCGIVGCVHAFVHKRGKYSLLK